MKIRQIIILLFITSIMSAGQTGTRWLSKAQELLTKNARTIDLIQAQDHDTHVFHFHKTQSPEYAAVLTLANSRSGTFPLLASFDEGGHIIHIWVLDYHEPYGREVTDKSWLKQFTGKNHLMLTDQKFKVDAISGATISSRSVIEKIIELSKSIADKRFKPRQDVPSNQ